MTNTTSSEDTRVEMARKYGLPETATLDDITKAGSEENRVEFARNRGLPESATWDDITAHDRNH